MAHFKNVETLEELRHQYKELLKKYHPDNVGGSVKITQEINAEYEKLFKKLKDKHEKSAAESTATREKPHSNMYDWKSDVELRAILDKIISLDGIDINIVGMWIWISGTTYPYRATLKDIGFKWSGNRKKWYWNNDEYKGRYNKKLTFEQIERKYGSDKFKAHAKVMLEM